VASALRVPEMYFCKLSRAARNRFQALFSSGSPIQVLKSALIHEPAHTLPIFDWVGNCARYSLGVTVLIAGSLLSFW
jgi:hypothetical protein